MNQVSRGRYVVLGASGIALVLKVLMAFRTYGTSDVGRWQAFADGVKSSGPVGVYGLSWPDLLYNHPPVIGYLLELVNAVGHLGVSVGAAIRVLASCADVISAVVVFEVLRRRGTVAVAIVSGVLVGVSPVLFLVSGFHGNTDTIFCMLTIVSLWLLADREMPVLAGATMALALGVKIVPIVAVPALLVYAASRGTRTFWRFAVAGAVVFGLFWGPAHGAPGPQRDRPRHLLHGLGPPAVGAAADRALVRRPGLVDVPRRSGPVRGAGAVLPAAGTRRPAPPRSAGTGGGRVAECVPAAVPGVRRAVRRLAGRRLLPDRSEHATLYNLAAGTMLFLIYNRWSGGLPWTMAHRHASAFTNTEVAVGIVAWCALLLVVVAGARRLLVGEGAADASADRRVSPSRAGDRR